MKTDLGYIALFIVITNSRIPKALLKAKYRTRYLFHKRCVKSEEVVQSYYMQNKIHLMMNQRRKEVEKPLWWH